MNDYFEIHEAEYEAMQEVMEAGAEVEGEDMEQAVCDKIFEVSNVYGNDLLVEYWEDGEKEEVNSSDMPEELWSTGQYEIVGYICPECGEPIYLADFDPKCVYACPVCDYEFEY